MGGSGGALGAGAAGADRRRQLSDVCRAADPNPLTAPILAILRDEPAALSEYELIRRLDPWWPPLPDDPALALFQKHFLVMNALYRLQAALAGDGLWLAISPLAISLHVAAEAGQVLAAQSDAALRDYYLDWNQLAATDRTGVDALLAGFWQRFHAADALGDAFAALALAPTSDWSAVVASYRRQAAATHPDRGGNAERFLAVRAAYEQLRLHFNR